MPSLPKEHKNQLSTILAILLVALLILGLAFVVYHYEYNLSFQREALILSGYQKDVAGNYTRKKEFTREIENLVSMRNYVRLGMVAENLTQLSPDSFAEVEKDYNSVENMESDYYLLNSQMSIIGQLAKVPLELSGEELEELIQNGRYQKEHRCYYAQKNGENCIVLAVNMDMSFASKIDYDLTKVVSYVIWENASGEVLESRNSPEEWKKEEYQWEKLSTINGIDINRVKIGGKSYLTASGTLTESGGEVTVCVFEAEGQVSREAVFGAVKATVFALLFIASAWFFAVHMKKRLFPGGISRNAFFIFMETYYKHTRLAMIRLGIIFSLVSTLLFFTQNVLQINYSIETEIQNLYQLQESQDENQQVIIDFAFQACTDYANDMVAALKYSYQMDTDERLKKMAEITQADEITLYDGNGVIVHSTGPYKGYRLTTCETDEEYILWRLLNSEDHQLVFYSSEKACTYLAVRRTDETGILLIKTSPKLLSSLMEKVEFADLLKSQSFSDKSIYYTERENPQTLYIISSGNAIEKATTNVLPLPESGKTVAGMRSIDGVNYLYVDVGSENWALAFVYPVKDLVLEGLMYLGLSAVFYCLLILVILLYQEKKYALIISMGSPDPLPEDPQALKKQFMNEKKIIFQLIFGAMSLISFLLIPIGSAILNGSSLLDFAGNWETGLNLITLIFAILSIMICAGIFFLIDGLNIQLGSLLSPKGTTILGLISALLKIALIVIFLVYFLEQLGVNTVAIASSLGLAGLSLSMGAKDMISDLVAGMLIAFEGQVEIGDYVKVNNFYGRITMLSLRTTTVKMANKEMVINNSSMKNFLNYSKGMSNFYINVVLPFDTDLDQLSQIIKDAEERFATACEGCLSRPLFFSGVNQYTSYGIECSFMGKTTQDKYYLCFYRCTTELTRVLQENNIHPAVAACPSDQSQEKSSGQ